MWCLLYAFAVKKQYFGEKAVILGNGEKEKFTVKPGIAGYARVL
jgi:hypothetical protein